MTREDVTSSLWILWELEILCKDSVRAVGFRSCCKFRWSHTPRRSIGGPTESFLVLVVWLGQNPLLLYSGTKWHVDNTSSTIVTRAKGYHPVHPSQYHCFRPCVGSAQRDRGAWIELSSLGSCHKINEWECLGANFILNGWINESHNSNWRVTSVLHQATSLRKPNYVIVGCLLRPESV